MPRKTPRTNVTIALGALVVVWLVLGREVTEWTRGSFLLGFTLATGILVIAAGGLALLILAHFALYAFFILAPAQRRRMTAWRAALAKSACPTCGATIGQAGVTAMEAENEARKERLFADARERGVKLRVDVRWHVQCPHCHATLVCDPRGEAVCTVIWRRE